MRRWMPRRALLGKDREHIVQKDTMWGLEGLLASDMISVRICALRRALDGKVDAHMEQLMFFVFFYVGWDGR